MDKIARIRQKIKELRELIDDHNYYLDNSEQALGYGLALDDIGQFLDTLSEEPDKNLEEAAYKYSFDSRPSIYGQVDVIDAFKAGAEWQASQMPMPEDTVLFNKGVAEGRRLEREDMLKDAVKVEGVVIDNGSGGTIIDTQCGVLYLPPLVYAVGEKVRIVVLKEEE